MAFIAGLGPQLARPNDAQIISAQLSDLFRNIRQIKMQKADDETLRRNEIGSCVEKAISVP